MRKKASLRVDDDLDIKKKMELNIIKKILELKKKRKTPSFLIVNGACFDIICTLDDYNHVRPLDYLGLKICISDCVSGFDVFVF